MQERNHCRSDKICPDQLVLTLVLLEQSVSDLIIHNNACLLVSAIIACLLESNRCSGGRDVRVDGTSEQAIKDWDAIFAKICEAFTLNFSHS